MQRVFFVTCRFLLFVLGLCMVICGPGCATVAEQPRKASVLSAKPSGIGLVFTDVNGCIEVSAVLERSSADLAGIRPGDRILQISSRSTQKMTALVANKLILGHVQSKIKVVVKSSNSIAQRTVTLERRHIPATAKWETLPLSTAPATPAAPAMVPPGTAVPGM